MTELTHTADVARICAERDFYRRLVELGQQSDLAPLLREALALIVELGGAQKGYLALEDEDDGEAPRWWIAHGFGDAEIGTIRRNISRGIISQAIASGETIVTPSALLDPRFSDRDSVRLGKIEAVLCAPIGHDPPRGVVYLQGRAEAGLFSDEERDRAELFARFLAPLVENLLAQQRTDPTRPLRARLRLDGVIGQSAALAAMLNQAALVAPLDVDVLLTGETGTGKSQLARIIHNNSRRANGPFIEVNCATLPEHLVESELFGAVAGAATDIRQARKGKVDAAENGTLFLDEISEMSWEMQGTLLQLVQAKEYFPVGSAKPVRADVRFIAATNIDLKRAVTERRFRDDLYYRLEVLPIRVPSLRERRDDVGAIAAFYCSSLCERHGFPRMELSRNALRAIESAEWPGNVRQLLHAVEAAVIRATGEDAKQVEPVHVFPDTVKSPMAPDEPQTYQVATRNFQRQLLHDTLNATEWNVSETARRLDLTRAHVYNKIEAFGLKKDET